jgi:hypothetical protein
MNMMVHMLTTVDNPFSPFTQFNEWFAFDTVKGYNTSGLLARLVITSDEISEADQNVAIETAMEEIVRENVSGMHRMVVADDYTTT